MFRVYMAPDGSPSKEASDKNVPYKPKKHLPVSMTGVEEGDFAMVFGFPGSTSALRPRTACSSMWSRSTRPALSCATSACSS